MNIAWVVVTFVLPLFEQIRIYARLFERIGEPDIIEQLASKNLLRIMPNEGFRLDPSYQYPEHNYTIHDAR